MSKIQQNKQKECIFCSTTIKNHLQLGEMMVTKNITSHYFCCLLSDEIIQWGRDDQGIKGFLPKDILAEVKRGSRLKCSYCKKNGATINCAKAQCKVKFHLPCAIKNKAKHEFTGAFRTYCVAHARKQTLPDPVKNMKDKICLVCLETIVDDDFIWAECCARHTFIHHLCAQKYAYSAGYELKCPLCKNIEQFRDLLQHMSVFIPDREATWELEPNAFSGLSTNYACAGDVCVRGDREFNRSDTLWELIICNHCSVNATHRFCSNMHLYEYRWTCDTCKKLLRSLEQNSSPALKDTENLIPQNNTTLEENHNNWTQSNAYMVKLQLRICVAQLCKSELGRLYEDNMKNPLIPCLICRNLYIHKICGNVKGNMWLCQTHKKLSQPVVLLENIRR